MLHSSRTTKNDSICVHKTISSANRPSSENCNERSVSWFSSSASLLLFSWRVCLPFIVLFFSHVFSKKKVSYFGPMWHYIFCARARLLVLNILLCVSDASFSHQFSCTFCFSPVARRCKLCKLCGKQRTIPSVHFV